MFWYISYDLIFHLCHLKVWNSFRLKLKLPRIMRKDNLHRIFNLVELILWFYKDHMFMVNFLRYLCFKKYIAGIFLFKKCQ